MQPLVPPQVPCPSPQAPSRVPEPVLTSINDLWPVETSTLLPSSVEQRMRQEKEERQEKIEKEREDKERREREQQRREMRQEEMLTGGQHPLAPQGLSQGQASGPGLTREKEKEKEERLFDKGFSIEEAFAQFSVLQSARSRLKQFGYEFFEVQAAGFAPVLDVPVGPDYVIGPQDSLAVHIWNVPDPNFNRSYIVPVERDGMVVIPQVGAIPVGGLTFSQAERAIETRLRGLLKRFEVHVAMARLRTIKVYVVGEVIRPGAYEISALATVSNAVYAACGPAKTGSLRQVKVIRDGKVLAELDFYEFLLAGDRSHDRRLQAGDVVMVPPIGPVAAISGAVKRSAIYELKPGTRLSDLLALAGGLTSAADRSRCHIFRVEPGRGRFMMDVDLGAVLANQDKGNHRPDPVTGDPPIQDGDYVRINTLPTRVANVVSLVGAVKSPGPYEFHPGLRVGDMLTPDQVTAEAYLERAEIIRTDPVTYQARIIPFSPKALFAGSQQDNHALQRLDQVVVASQVRPPNLVSIEGEVKRPGYYTIEVGERLSSLLKRAGGFTANAYPPGIVVIRESVKKKQQAEMERFIQAERERLAAQSASVAAGTAGLAGGAALQSYGPIAEQQIFALRLQQLEAALSRVELGRVVVRLDSIESLEGTEDDIRLEARDKIMIPTPPQTVSVIGSVKNPTNVVHRVGLTLDDYLRQAGGVTEGANQREIFIMHANGATEGAYVRVKDIQPGDTIVVPQKVEAKTPTVALWQAVASSLGSLMLGAAAIAVIGR